LALPPITGAQSPIQGIQPASNPRAAAQKAFFDAALRRAQEAGAPQAAAPTAATAARPAAPVRVQPPAVQISDTPPDRPMRPGSMVNILV